MRVGVGPTVIIFRAEISHCRALVRWNGHAQAEAGVPASSSGACCSWRRPERRRVQGPWEQISGRECDHFRSKIRFHGPCAVAPRAVQVARAGAAVGSGTGRAGGRARPGGRGGTVKIENRPQQKICFGYTLYFSKTQIRIAIPFFLCTMCTGSIRACPNLKYTGVETCPFTHQAYTALKCNKGGRFSTWLC